MDNGIKEWSFAFFDLGSKESARRVRLHRNLRRVGAALHSQSVYCMPYSKGSFDVLKNLDKDMFVIKADVGVDEIDELVKAYEIFTTSLINEVDDKFEALENAKASATDMQTRRGYTKRLNKMYERLEHLYYIATIGKNAEAMDKVDTFYKRISEIDFPYLGR